MAEEVITRDPEIMSGTPCFRGTRVPFQTLLDYLEGGETLDDFLEQFPGVTRKMAIAARERQGISACPHCMKILLDERVPVANSGRCESNCWERAAVTGDKAI